MNKNQVRSAELLETAIQHMKGGSKPFVVKPWREIMAHSQHSGHSEASQLPHFGRRSTEEIMAAALVKGLPFILEEEIMVKAQAIEKQAALKTATKKAASKGITKPKHKPTVAEAQQPNTEEAEAEGVDTTSSGMLHSGFSVFNQPLKENTMTETTTPKPPQATLDKEATVKAKIEAKAAKLAAAAEAKAKREAKAAEKKAAREARAQETQAQREARAAELKEAGKTYVGSMLALADRVKQGLYVKSATGQLRSTDALAEALDAVPPENVVKLGTMLFGEENKYAALNIGQQSMNYRNRMRGAIKKGTFTLADVTAKVEEHGFATAHAELEAKAKAKAEREAKQAQAKAEKEAKAQAKAKQPEPEATTA